MLWTHMDQRRRRQLYIRPHQHVKLQPFWEKKLSQNNPKIRNLHSFRQGFWNPYRALPETWLSHDIFSPTRRTVGHAEASGNLLQYRNPTPRGVNQGTPEWFTIQAISIGYTAGLGLLVGYYLYKKTLWRIMSQSVGFGGRKTHTLRTSGHPRITDNCHIYKPTHLLIQIYLSK